MGAVGHDPGRDRVVEVQRVRVIGAMIEELAEHGAANVSVAGIVARSGVSRRTFYELFDGRDECFQAAFDQALHDIRAIVRPVYEQPDTWQEQIRAGLIALLDCLQRDPKTARLLVVESLAAGPRMLALRQEALAPIVAIVDRGRQHASGPDPAPLTAQGIVGGVLGVLHDRLTEQEQPNLLELTGPLMAMITTPYLGAANARKQLQRPVPTPSVDQRGLHAKDPLHELPMRLTYRTARTLTAIASRPGSSNRHIGELSEINDQGQVSKLLNRLQRLGLIHNAGPGATTRGEANAWTLTPTGHQVHNTITNTHMNGGSSATV